MQVKIKKIHEKAKIPTYGSFGAACFDFYSIEQKNIIPGTAEVFATGLSVEIPEGYVMLIFSRSGHGFNFGMRLSNCVGVIDSDYRGELKVKLHCEDQSYEVIVVADGDRIAQGIIIPFDKVNWDIVDNLSDTERGIKGFGSTGN